MLKSKHCYLHKTNVLDLLNKTLIIDQYEKKNKFYKIIRRLFNLKKNLRFLKAQEYNLIPQKKKKSNSKYIKKHKVKIVRVFNLEKCL